MSHAPVVSVIMPAYKARDTIAASVKSLQAQTLQNWELIIVDDGSPDDTAEIACKLAENDRGLASSDGKTQAPPLPEIAALKWPAQP